jgi:hypothetical protein
MTLTCPARTLVPLLALAALAALAACAPAATTPGGTPGPEAAAERIADGSTAEADLAIRVPVEVLERYVGEYQMPPGILSVRRSGDTLTVQASEQPEAFVLEPRSQTRFQVQGAPVVVEFVTDEAGAVSLLVSQGDQEIRGDRVSP